MKTVLHQGRRVRLSPLLMTQRLVRQTLDKKKDQTRRDKGLEIINEDPKWFRFINNSIDWPDMPREAKKYDREIYYAFTGVHNNSTIYVCTCPYGKPGDILWIRETWRKYYFVDDLGYTNHDKEIIEYAADNPPPVREIDGDGFGVFKKEGSEKYIPWKPNIHMHFSACRLFLQIVDVRPERLEQISAMDAINEGIEPFNNGLNDTFYDYVDGENTVFTKGLSPQRSFWTLWESINGLENLYKNPWVWRIQFKIVDKSELTF
jgi:hypothetical protein